MRMITRCPACGTAFRIYQEQLDARQGQVRCGHCAVVFSAHEHLVVEPDAPGNARPAPPAPAPHTEPARPAQQPPADAAKPTVERPPATPAQRVPTPDTEPVAAKPEEGAGATPPATPERPKPAPDAKPSPDAKAASGAKAAPESKATPAGTPSPAPKPEPVELSMADATQFDFGPAAQAAQRAGPWWTAATVVLIVLLFLQGLFLFRTELARALPVARPALEQACAALGCEVPYPREADLISLEASDLQAVPGAPDVLRLSAVLRNRATFAQAFPAIELTLTDERNVTVARRVLRPRDYLPKERPVAFAPTTELPLELHIDAAQLGASGYRLYIYYP